MRRVPRAHAELLVPPPGGPPTRWSPHPVVPPLVNWCRTSGFWLKCCRDPPIGGAAGQRGGDRPVGLRGSAEAAVPSALRGAPRAHAELLVPPPGDSRPVIWCRTSGFWLKCCRDPPIRGAAGQRAGWPPELPELLVPSATWGTRRGAPWAGESGSDAG